MGGTYTDKDGYLRYKDSRRLVHRDVAFTEIYQPNRGRYRLPFADYEAHHKNLKKKDNRRGNLELLTETEHKRLHHKLAHDSDAMAKARFGYDDRSLAMKVVYHVLLK